jgi:anti-sigma factor RsiW
MNPEPCREMEEWLVDYADGVLPPEEVGRIAEHIERCDGCREAVETLRESMQIAGAVWLDTLHEIEPACTLHTHKSLRLWNLRHVAIVAGILLIIGGGLFRSVWKSQVPAPPTFAEMERQISESATAARLLAATDVLKTQAIEPDRVQAQYQHIVEQYPNTDAAAQVRLKLKSIR